jgi:hypothetical protein
MSTLSLLLILGLCLSISCASKPNSGISNNQAVITNTPLNSNINNLLLSNSNSNSTTDNNPSIDPEMIKKIEAQQLEDKRKAEEKLKHGGNPSNSNSNAPGKSSVPKGNQQTY